MIRIILIIAAILIAMPFVEKGIDYFKEKSRKAKFLGETAKKAIKYKD